ncbi:MAG: hypothetical protein HYT36_03260 [Candidatus Staskawiczbacteria bacterium]|nr:hypothetical protein [Candidatus Staskawiczbacteria bacterium]
MKSVRLLSPYSGQMRIEPISLLAPKIMITFEVLRKTAHFLEFCCARSEEFSWVGKVKHVESPVKTSGYLIEDIVALKQTNSASETRLDAKAIAKIASQWVNEAGGKANPLKFWGHAHLFASTQPSYQDNNQMEELIRGNATPVFFIRGIFSPAPVCHRPDSSAFSSAVYQNYNIHRNTDVEGRHQTFQAEFTVFDYQKEVAFVNVAWEVVDEYDCEELKSLLTLSVEQEEARAYSVKTSSTDYFNYVNELKRHERIIGPSKESEDE